MVKVSNNIRTVSLRILCHLGVCFVLASCLCIMGPLRIVLVPITALLLFFFLADYNSRVSINERLYFAGYKGDVGNLVVR